MAKRIQWVDVVRCFGIFAIYLGHFGDDAGRAFPFVMSHHVALFFFISGCLAPRTPQPFWPSVRKILRDLLLPWLVFAVCAVMFNAVYMNTDLYSLVPLFKQIALGTIVDQFIAGSLWFFVGLANVKLLFWFLQKLRSRALILAVCLVLFLIEARYPVPKYYNLHRAFRFIIYYALGNFSFPAICKALSPSTRRGRLLLAASGVGAFFYSALLFFGVNPLEFLLDVSYVRYLTTIVNALVPIWLYILAAKLLEGVELFNQMGRKTLYLCGSEYFIRLLLKSFVRLFGLELSYPRPVCAYLCAALLLYLAWRYLVPMEERLLSFLRQLPTRLRITPLKPHS